MGQVTILTVRSPSVHIKTMVSFLFSLEDHPGKNHRYLALVTGPLR